jgi:hypothetical protein
MNTWTENETQRTVSYGSTLFLKHYHLLENLPSNTIFYHSWWSLTNACLFVVPIIFESSSTLSLYLLWSFPLLLIPSIAAAAVCFDICWFCILFTWPYYLDQKDFINFRLYVPCNMFFTSLHVVLLQCSFICTYIFLHQSGWNVSEEVRYTVFDHKRNEEIFERLKADQLMRN